MDNLEERAESYLCEYRFPTSKVFMNDLSRLEMVTVFLAGVCTLVTICVHLFHMWTFEKMIESEYRQHILATLSRFYPITAVCAFLAITVPATMNLMKILIPFFLTHSLIAFNQLINDLFGGNKKMMARRLEDCKMTINMTKAPLCCLRIFGLTNVQPTTRVFRILEMLIWQCAVVQTVLAFAVFVAFAEGKDIVKFGLVTDVIKILSTFIAVGSCFALADVTNRAINARYKLYHIIILLKLSLFVVNIQGGIFGILSATGVIPENGLMNKSQNATFWNDQLMCLEMMIFEILASVWFRPAVCDLFFESDEIDGKSIASKEYPDVKFRPINAEPVKINELEAEPRIETVI